VVSPGGWHCLEMKLQLLMVFFICWFNNGMAENTAPIKAQAILMTNSQLGISQRLGTVIFTQASPNDPVYITGQLTFDGRKDPITMLGMHIHAYGNLTQGCDSTGSHFNPTGQHHGSRTEAARHIGDLGNIIITNQRTTIDIVDNVVQLTGPHSIIGRALVVHQSEDDLGKGGNEESLKTGNAGKRFACGIIGLSSDVNEFPQSNSAAPLRKLFSIFVVVLGILAKKFYL